MQLNKRKKNRIPEIVFICYAFVVLVGSALSSVISRGLSVHFFYYLIVALALLVFAPKISQSIQSLVITLNQNLSIRKQIKVYTICSIVSMFVLISWYVGCAPGAFSPDTIDQLSQAQTGKYVDWHPVLQTLFTFKIPLLFFGSYHAIIPFQIVLFSLMMGYLGMVVYPISSRKVLLLIFSFILLSPFTLNILMYPWKDVAFAMAATMCLLISFRYLFVCGCEKDGTLRVLFLALFLSLATIFRHNGALFTIPLIIVLFSYMPKRKWSFLLILSFLFVLGTKNILYSSMGVQKTEGRVVETMGLPLSIIFFTAKECPECLPKSTQEFVNAVVLDNNQWRESYDVRGFNTIKFSGIDSDVIESAGRWNILKMAGESFFRSPYYALMAFGALESTVYGLDLLCVPDYQIADNNSGIRYEGFQSIYNLGQLYTRVLSQTPLKWPFCTIGFSVLFLFALILFRCPLLSKGQVKTMLLCGPIMVYDCGTALFLSGGDFRFFFVNQLVMPLIALAVFKKIPNRQDQLLSEHSD